MYFKIKRSYNLGFGATTPNRSVISKSNTLRDYRIYEEFALLYKYRWQVELFFKWIKQHLKVKSFWGESENAVRIQIHVAIITYCLVGIIEHDYQVDRPVVEAMRILGHSLLVQDDINELLKHPLVEDEKDDDRQLLF